jgi:hypothetical protein
MSNPTPATSCYNCQTLAQVKLGCRHPSNVGFPASPDLVSGCRPAAAVRAHQQWVAGSQ